MGEVSGGAYDLALAGDLNAGVAALGPLGAEDPPAARAEQAALWALLDFSGWAGPPFDPSRLPGGDRPPTPEAITPWARAASHAGRRLALAFDRPALGSLTQRIAPWAQTSDEGRVHLGLLQAWGGLLGGSDPSADLHDLIAVASGLRRAELLLEATALLSLAQAQADRIEEALQTARRASRMSRTEGLPHFEALANVVLARLRRLHGRPHLAARILHALDALVAPVWRPWIGLELRWATGRGPTADDEGLGLGALDRALAAARAGDGAALQSAASALEASLARSPIHGPDLLATLGLIDPRVPVERLPPAAQDWARGRAPLPPRGLFGLLGDATKDGPGAYVWSSPKATPRRFLALGPPPLPAEPIQRLRPAEGGPQLRTDSAIAVLLLAGPEGLGEPEFFQALYGFAFEAERHQATRDVLYQRIKKRALPAQLQRAEGRLRLVHHGELLAPDPRAAPPPELDILRLLSERRQAAAKDVAQLLGIPLRTAQDALARLAEDGALRKEKARAGLHYLLEDTTFSEPTRRFGRALRGAAP